MDQQAIVFRRASEQDQQAIRALVHSERLNPTGINWPNFLVAPSAAALSALRRSGTIPTARVSSARSWWPGKGGATASRHA